jgi:hypothetical protein
MLQVGIVRPGGIRNPICGVYQTRHEVLTLLLSNEAGLSPAQNAIPDGINPRSVRARKETPFESELRLKPTPIRLKIVQITKDTVPVRQLQLPTQRRETRSSAVFDPRDLKALRKSQLVTSMNVIPKRLEIRSHRADSAEGVAEGTLDHFLLDHPKELFECRRFRAEVAHTGRNFFVKLSLRFYACCSPFVIQIRLYLSPLQS